MMRKILPRSVAVAVMAAAVVSAPCAAHAAFTAAAAATMPVSTLALASTEGTFRVDCNRNPTGPYHLLVLAADSLSAVPGATGYEVVLRGPAGERVVESFTKEGDMVTYVKKKGDWTYAIRAIRAVTAANTWTGPLSSPKIVNCS